MQSGELDRSMAMAGALGALDFWGVLNTNINMQA